MNVPASYMWCRQCACETLHTSRGCCRHPAARITSPAARTPRRRPSRGLGRPAATDLTAAERRVAHLIATGLTQSEIAVQLKCHPSSVSNTVRRAISRLGIETTYELVRHMRQRGTGGV